MKRIIFAFILISFIAFNIKADDYSRGNAETYANHYCNAGDQAGHGYNVTKIDKASNQINPDYGLGITAANTWYQEFAEDDCANFVSQCLIAGGLDSLMNYSGGTNPAGGNQYNNTNGIVTTRNNATIIGVTDNALQDYLKNYYHAGYIYALADPSIVGGDVFVIPQGQGETRHAMFIVDVNGTALSCDAHTTDRQNYVMHSDLSAYSYSPCLYSFFHIYPTVKMWISGYMTLQVLWFGKKW